MQEADGVDDAEGGDDGEVREEGLAGAEEGGEADGWEAGTFEEDDVGGRRGRGRLERVGVEFYVWGWGKGDERGRDRSRTGDGLGRPLG